MLSAVFFMGLKQFLPARIFPESAPASANVVVDSMLLDAFKSGDNIANGNANPLKGTESRRIIFPEIDGIRFPAEPYEDYRGYQYILSFFEKLVELENGQRDGVRIAYFGDSMTDGDMIVQDLRSSFQQQFGGVGVGFVPITSESAGSRSSVTHAFSANWKTQSYLNIKYPISPFGINGHVFFANDTATTEWVLFKANKGRFTAQLPNPTLFYGRSSNFGGRVRILNRADTIYKQLAPSQLVYTLALSPEVMKSLKVDFLAADSIPIYGLNFDNGRGIHIDNFSQRGNSGIPISKFNIPLMRAFQQKLDYNLIVLHYGTNVLSYGTKNYRWYEKSMTRVVNRLRECFPGVAILIVSTADKSSKYDMQMKTDSAVVPLTSAQKSYALNTQSGFVNLYTLMGGDGSMVRWVEGEPALANKDYTHFNFRGSRKIGTLLYDQLITGYVQYKKLRKKVPAKQDNETADAQ